jgi:hypothetical protein
MTRDAPQDVYWPAVTVLLQNKNARSSCIRGVFFHHSGSANAFADIRHQNIIGGSSS